MIAKEYIVGIYRERYRTFMEEPFFIMALRWSKLQLKTEI
jgi:hypothetical protein